MDDYEGALKLVDAIVTDIRKDSEEGLFKITPS
jgi:hypothetical protein